MAEETMAVDATAQDSGSLDAGTAEASPQGGDNGQPQSAGAEGATASSGGSEAGGEQDNIKRLRSSYDRQVARKNKELQDTKAQLKELEEQQKKLTARQEQDQLSRMTEAQRKDYLLNKALQEREQFQRELQFRDQKARYEERINKLMDSTGVPRDLLEKTESYDEAVQMALEYNQQSMDQRIEQLVNERVDKAIASRAANSTDTGASAPEPDVDPVAKALENRNSLEYLRAVLGPGES